MRRRLMTIALTGALALGMAACDGNAQDDLENIEENVEEGVGEVGEGLEDTGSEMQEESSEMDDGDDADSDS
jgi:hypothetical protein